jgi:hypothetical protein
MLGCQPVQPSAARASDAALGRTALPAGTSARSARWHPMARLKIRNSPGVAEVHIYDDREENSERPGRAECADPDQRTPHPARLSQSGAVAERAH